MNGNANGTNQNNTNYNNAAGPPIPMNSANQMGGELTQTYSPGSAASPVPGCTPSTAPWSNASLAAPAPSGLSAMSGYVNGMSGSGFPSMAHVMSHDESK